MGKGHLWMIHVLFLRGGKMMLQHENNTNKFRRRLAGRGVAGARHLPTCKRFPWLPSGSRTQSSCGTLTWQWDTLHQPLIESHRQVVEVFPLWNMNFHGFCCDWLRRPRFDRLKTWMLGMCHSGGTCHGSDEVCGDHPELGWKDRNGGCSKKKWEMKNNRNLIMIGNAW